jgi:hypothetical protein
MNNPLRYTDPTGYKWLNNFGHWIDKTDKKALNTAVSVFVDVVVITVGIPLANVATAGCIFLGVGC